MLMPHRRPARTQAKRKRARRRRPRKCSDERPRLPSTPSDHYRELLPLCGAISGETPPIASAAATFRRQGSRGRNLVVPDAMIVADPIDALAFARRISVAGLNPPCRRVLVSNIFQRASHRLVLLLHALPLPLANEADVQSHRIIEGGRARAGVSFARSRGQNDHDSRERGTQSGERPPHRACV